MIDREFKLPLVYQEMNKRGYLDKSKYLWLNEMEWMTIDKIYSYSYEEEESKLIVPFAFTGGGDKWVWIVKDVEIEYCVGLCQNGEVNGIYYAKNMEDAIFRQIVEYISDSNFYTDNSMSKSYQICDEELKAQLNNWVKCFEGILSNRYLELIKGFSEKKLKHIECQYGEWDALLSLEERNVLIDKYIKFDLIDQEFEWYKI